MSTPTRKAIDVKGLRDRMGLTQRDLAKRLWETDDPTPAHERSISRWENGHHEPHAMAKLALKRLAREHDDKEAAKAVGGSEGPKRKALVKGEGESEKPIAPPTPPRRSAGVLPGM